MAGSIAVWSLRQTAGPALCTGAVPELHFAAAFPNLRACRRTPLLPPLAALWLLPASASPPAWCAPPRTFTATPAPPGSSAGWSSPTGGAAGACRRGSPSRAGSSPPAQGSLEAADNLCATAGSAAAPCRCCCRSCCLRCGSGFAEMQLAAAPRSAASPTTSLQVLRGRPHLSQLLP